MTPSDALALRRAKLWHQNAIQRRERFSPPAAMPIEQIRRREAKLDADIKTAEKLVAVMEDQVWRDEANFGGVDVA